MTEIGPNKEQKTESKGDSAKAVESAAQSSLFGEFMQSMKYSAVQRPYDGLNQLAGHVFGYEPAARELVKAPPPAESGSAAWYAQQAGAGLATVGEVLVLHRGLRSLAPGVKGSSLALGETALTGRMTAESLALSAGIYEGFATVSRENNFYKDRLGAAFSSAASVYAFGKLHSEGGKLLASEKVAEKGALGLVQSYPRLAGAATGFGAGGAASFIGVEVRTRTLEGRWASMDEVKNGVAAGSLLGMAFGAGFKPVAVNPRGMMRDASLRPQKGP
ncbi:MAG: hypothetical protein K2Y32_07885 [Candidatus Obscuribacterales bacterium]|nr:hypothetical protein [Candidatus Obscuribacterales bacterium]